MRRIDDSLKSRMFLVWAVALIACFFPPSHISSSLPQFIHRPLFLLAFPLAMACIPLFLPERKQLGEEEHDD